MIRTIFYLVIFALEFMSLASCKARKMESSEESISDKTGIFVIGKVTSASATSTMIKCKFSPTYADIRGRAPRLTPQQVVGLVEGPSGRGGGCSALLWNSQIGTDFMKEPDFKAFKDLCVELCNNTQYVSTFGMPGRCKAIVTASFEDTDRGFDKATSFDESHRYFDGLEKLIKSCYQQLKAR